MLALKNLGFIARNQSDEEFNEVTHAWATCYTNMSWVASNPIDEDFNEETQAWEYLVSKNGSCCKVTRVMKILMRKLKLEINK